jgi:hypothetical protein
VLNTQTPLTDTLERELAARQANRISQPLDLRRFAHAWGGRARRALRGG